MSDAKEYAMCTEAYLAWRAQAHGRNKGTQEENALSWNSFRAGWLAKPLFAEAFDEASSSNELPKE
jgi:hypothetical protein